MCPVFLPLATVPLWQDEQADRFCTCEWSSGRIAGFQVELRWQDSHLSDDAICVGFLPVAWVPSWQVEQLAVIAAWLKLTAGFHAVVA